MCVCVCVCVCVRVHAMYVCVYVFREHGLHLHVNTAERNPSQGPRHEAAAAARRG